MIPVASVYPAYVIGNGSRAARELSRTARLGMSPEIAGGGSGYRLQESLSPTAERLSAVLFLLLAGLSGSRQRDLLRCSRLVVVDGQLSVLRRGIGRSEGHRNFTALSRRQRLDALALDREWRGGRLTGDRYVDPGSL